MRLIDGAEGWALRNIQPDGSYPYLVGEPGDNAIRRFLMPVALAELAALRGSAAIHELARRNLEWCLKTYLREADERRSFVVEKRGLKLGAAACAGQAIIAVGGFERELARIAAGIDSLFDERYGFRTFASPPERDGENWHYYLPEALLFWAEMGRKRMPGAPDLERVARAFELSAKKFHRLCRGQRGAPAFIPWYVRAARSLYDWIGPYKNLETAFQMSDWLESMQQWDGVEPQHRGRFHDPTRPHYGPPHVASTGAYLEGYAAAIELARAVGDAERQVRYLRIARRALASLERLQLRNITDGARLGHLLTEHDRAQLRIDNLAHVLVACCQLCRDE